jgi:hypothetical protein
MREISTCEHHLVAGGRTFAEVNHGQTEYEVDGDTWTLTTYDERAYRGPSLWTKTLDSSHAHFRLEYDCDDTTCVWTLSGSHFVSGDEFAYEGKEAVVLREIGSFEGNQKFQEVVDNIWRGATWHVPTPPEQRNYYCDGKLVRMPASGPSEGWNLRAFPPC